MAYVKSRMAVALSAAWCCSAPMAKEADNWVEVRSPHFTVATAASEGDARKIADQFEQVRELFHKAFPTLRLDPAQPVVIIAAKNEKGMRELLPENWEVKGHVHLAGLYQPGFDKHYVILQLDAPGENPYHVLYHEYTHSLLHLNYSNMPLWLDEGLAEYLGNATIGAKDSRIGVVDPGHLYILQNNRLLPIETLLAVDQSSPHYNEANRASVFYAESWALVHYLMLSPESRQKQLLGRFMEAWTKSGDQLEAAQQGFGDLKKFGQIIEAYARQPMFYNGVIKNVQAAGDKNYPARTLSPAEVLALRGDFFVHHNRTEAGKPVLEEAARQDPHLKSVHEALAFYYFRARDSKRIGDEIETAMQLGSTSFFSFYLRAVAEMHENELTEERLERITAALEKSALANPNFAPAYDMLATAYSMSPDKKAQAVNSGIQAVKLDPTDLQYAYHLTYLLMSNNRGAEAKIMADRILAASSPREKEKAQSLVLQVREHREAIASGKAAASLPAGVSGAIVVAREGNVPTGSSDPNEGQGPPVLAHRMLVGVEGSITEADCSKSPEVNVSLDGPGGNIRYHITDAGKITITAPGDGEAPACAQWKGRKAKVWFQLQAGSAEPGEVRKLNFQ